MFVIGIYVLRKYIKLSTIKSISDENALQSFWGSISQNINIGSCVDGGK